MSLRRAKWIVPLALVCYLLSAGMVNAQEKVKLKYTYWGSPLEREAQAQMLKDFRGCRETHAMKRESLREQEPRKRFA